jgi:hypothetical protein
MVSARAHPPGRIIDRVDILRHYQAVMQEGQTADARRSSRVFVRIRVLAKGKNHNGKKFREMCETVVVNTHGGLLYLRQDVDTGTVLALTNPMTQEEEECRIVYQSDAGERGQRVGIEFLSPSPHFWGVDFKPSKPADENVVH